RWSRSRAWCCWPGSSSAGTSGSSTSRPEGRGGSATNVYTAGTEVIRHDIAAVPTALRRERTNRRGVGLQISTEALMRTPLKLVTGIGVLAGAIGYSAAASAEPYFHRYMDGSWTNAEY